MASTCRDKSVRRGIPTELVFVSAEPESLKLSLQSRLGIPSEQQRLVFPPCLHHDISGSCSSEASPADFFSEAKLWQAIVFAGNKSTGRLVHPRVDITSVPSTPGDQLTDAKAVTLIFDYWQASDPFSKTLFPERPLNIPLDSSYKEATFRIQVIGKHQGTSFALPINYTFSGKDTAAAVATQLQKLDYIKLQHTKFAEASKETTSHPVIWSQHEYTVEIGTPFEQCHLSINIEGVVPYLQRVVLRFTVLQQFQEQQPDSSVPEFPASILGSATQKANSTRSKTKALKQRNVSNQVESKAGAVMASLQLEAAQPAHGHLQPPNQRGHPEPSSPQQESQANAQTSETLPVVKAQTSIVGDNVNPAFPQQITQNVEQGTHPVESSESRRRSHEAPTTQTAHSAAGLLSSDSSLPLPRSASGRSATVSTLLDTQFASSIPHTPEHEPQANAVYEQPAVAKPPVSQGNVEIQNNARPSTQQASYMEQSHDGASHQIGKPSDASQGTAGQPQTVPVQLLHQTGRAAEQAPPLSSLYSTATLPSTQPVLPDIQGQIPSQVQAALLPQNGKRQQPYMNGKLRNGMPPDFAQTMDVLTQLQQKLEGVETDTVHTLLQAQQGSSRAAAAVVAAAVATSPHSDISVATMSSGIAESTRTSDASVKAGKHQQRPTDQHLHVGSDTYSQVAEIDSLDLQQNQEASFHAQPPHASHTQQGDVARQSTYHHPNHSSLGPPALQSYTPYLDAASSSSGYSRQQLHHSQHPAVQGHQHPHQHQRQHNSMGNPYGMPFGPGPNQGPAPGGRYGRPSNRQQYSSHQQYGWQQQQQPQGYGGSRGSAGQYSGGHQGSSHRGSHSQRAASIDGGQRPLSRGPSQQDMASSASHTAPSSPRAIAPTERPHSPFPAEPVSTTDLDRFMAQTVPYLPPLQGDAPLETYLQELCLDDLWRFYEEPSLYGREVYSLGGARGPSLCYFVPYLSAMQLFIPASPTDPPGTRQLYICERDQPNQSKHFPKHMHMRFEYVEHELPFNRTPLYDQIQHLSRQPDTFAAQSAPSASPAATSNSQPSTTADGTSVPGSSSETGSPDTAGSQQSTSSSSRNSSDTSPASGIPAPSGPWLKTAKLVDLHPASWFAVAWYPVYRIPDAPLMARFMTFHSFTPVVESIYNALHRLPSSGQQLPIKHMFFPVTGLKWYNLAGERWLDEVTEPVSDAQPDPRTAGRTGGRPGASTPANRPLDPAYAQHLNNMATEAERMARGLGLRVLGSQGGEDVRLRVPDFEFFASRS